MIPNLKIDYVVLNAGVLRYPNVRHLSSPLPSILLTLTEIDRIVRLPSTIHLLLTSQHYVQFGRLMLTSSFDEFAFHLHTNAIGPIITAQKLLQTNIPIGLICFMSSDSGSQGNFREMEDGFAAYAASKAALNMAVRHMAAELKRKDDVSVYLWKWGVFVLELCV